MAPPRTLALEHTIVVQAQPSRVLDAFIDANDLAHWWQVVRSVTVPRPLGPFAVEWVPTEFRDEVLGRLGGTLHGTVMEYVPGRELFLADAYWQPPEGAPVGPMGLEISCRPKGTIFTTELRVRMSGEDGGPRWQRYFDIMNGGWERALFELKDYLDRESLRERKNRS